MKANFIPTLLMIGFSCILITPIGHTADARDDAQHQDQIKVEDEIKVDSAKKLGLAAQKTMGAGRCCRFSFSASWCDN